MIDPKAVAIVGLGAILPDAPDASTFWKNILASRYSITEVPPARWRASDYFDPDPLAPDKTYSKIGGWVKSYEFDPLKWGIPIPPRVLAVMDDGQKWAIAAARQALQDYGYPQRPLDPVRTAVILGNAMAGENHYRTSLRIHLPDYLNVLSEIPDFQNLPAAVQESLLRGMTSGIRKLVPDVTEDTMPGELSNVIAGRVANVFNFAGPNFITDAACASSFAALQSAVEGLVAHKFDAALTGGIDHNMGVEGFVKFSKIGALSPDGSRPYADGANGFVMGEGGGIFLLKRLVDAERDGDKVYAVVRGIGSSSDGKGKGITAPNPIGQQRAVERAWQDAGLSPASVTLIEGHGTSTRVGDVAEVTSLAAAFAGLDLAPASVALGSVKSNIGHLKAAAGAAGMLKTVLALHEHVLPPSVNFERPNPSIDFPHLPFFVNTASRDWEQPSGGVRRAGISSFGFGGTNFHVVLEEYLPGMLTTERSLHPGVEIAGAAAAVPAVETTEVPAVQPAGMQMIDNNQGALSPSDEEIKTQVLALVSEATGYPTEMLDLELDLEADLGIDTVKQAELFTNVRQIYSIPRREDLRLADYNTLAKVIQFVKDAVPTRVEVAVTEQPVAADSGALPTESAGAQRSTCCAPTETESAVGEQRVPTEDEIKTTLLALVSEKTGYPPEMLDLELDLEADLGIDTVKQAELFVAVRETYGIPRREDLRLSDYNTLAKVIQFVQDALPAASGLVTEPGQTAVQSQQPETPVEADAALPQAGDPVIPSEEEIKTTLLALVSEKTGYPPEMLDLELDLEADLGIDTVKQAELFVAVRETYGIPRREDLRLSDYNTLAKVIQFVQDSLPATQNQAVDAEAQPAKSAGAEQTDSAGAQHTDDAGAQRSTCCAPTEAETESPLPPRGLLFFSANSPAELKQRLLEAAEQARQGTLPPSRTPSAAELSQPERLAIDYETAEELVKKAEKTLRGFDSDTPAAWQALTGQGVYRGRGAPGKIIFMFPGQGSQYANMLRELRDLSPVVADTFREADEVMAPILGKPLTELIFVENTPETIARAEEALKDTTITQPAVLAANIAMMRLLGSYGFHPDLVIGHSLGEYGALVTAGVLSFADALRVVSARGREMARVSMDDNGCMAAVSAPIAEVERILKTVDGYVVIANINSPVQSVIGGATTAVEAALAAFQAAGFQAVKIPVSHAFHTRIVAPASIPLRAVIAKMDVRPPRIPIVANVTGQLYPSGREEILDMLAAQLASPVQFIQMMQTLYSEGGRILVECGPKRVLTALATDNYKDRADVTILSTNHPRKGALPSLNEALCGLYAAGAVPTFATEEPAALELASQPVQVEELQATPTSAPAVVRDGRLPLTGSVVISGAGLGLPGRDHPVFDDNNIQRILAGENMIEPLPENVRQNMLDKRVTRLEKSAAGATIEIITDLERTIKLAGQRGAFDPAQDFGIPAERVEATDIATQLAIAAGMEALRDAGIPLVLRYRQTSVGSYLPDRWMLPESLADETGVIFGSAFPGLDSMAEEAEHYYRHQHLTREIETLRQLQSMAASAPEIQMEINARLAGLESELHKLDYKFDRRYIFRILNMGHSQFAEYIGARGPNTSVNAACATTTHAVSLAEDWIRSGRARRVVIISGDDVTGGGLVEWVGTGLFASGATTTEGNLRLAALPFDRRRNGMIMGMGAAALVVESEDAVRERGMRGIAEVLAAQIGNSAFHGTRLDVHHVSEVMQRVLAQAEERFGLQREQIAPRTVFISHETYTPARGGSAAAEIRALRETFNGSASRVVIANTKGFTGHAMGVGIEDVVAVKALENQTVPPIANFDDEFEPDPDLGDLNLSHGGQYDVDYALRLGAGFGSQIAMTLLRRIPGQKERVDGETYRHWLSEVAGYEQAEVEVTRRTLRVRDQGVPLRSPARSNWQTGQGPTLWAGAPEPSSTATGVPAVEAGVVEAGQARPEEHAPVISEAQAVETAAVETAPVLTDAAISPSDEEIKAQVLALVSEATGYPTEMLDLELDLEADLGIDTVKQAELFANVRQIYSIPRREDLRLADYNTLAKVIQFVKDAVPTRVEVAVTEQPVAADSGALPTESAEAQRSTCCAPTETESAVGEQRVPTEDEIKTTLLALVSEKTGYPPEMLDLELDLEADLGIDTVKQAELFVAVRETYGIPRREDLRLSDYNTLAKVIQFVQDALAGMQTGQPETRAAAPAIAEEAEPVQAQEIPATRVPRRVPVPVLRPRLELCKPTRVEFNENLHVIVAHDHGKTGESLARKLRQYKVQVLDLYDLAPEAIESQAAAWNAAGKIDGVYFLPALDLESPLSSTSVEGWQADNRGRVYALYSLMHALPGDPFLIAATRMGGLHGILPGAIPAPLGGAVSGFTKAYAWEHPRTLVKVVDFARGASATSAAANLFDETLRDPGAVEIGLENEQRYTISLVERHLPAGQTSLALSKNTVYLVTGSTGGISAPILLDLARSSGGVFYLTGRSPLPDPSNPDLARLTADREGLKRDLAARMLTDGEKVTPVKIEQRLTALERSAAALELVNQLQAAGCRASYQSLDVTDPAAVEALFRQIAAAEGRLDVIIHAAGVDQSKALSGKTFTEFQRVFATKADGYFNLVRALPLLPQPPQAVVAFTSVAGRFGNAGQTDYAAANDLISKLAAALHHASPHIRFLALDWGAWAEVGMATRGSVPLMMEKAGIEMLKPQEAAPLVRAELLAESQGEVVLAGALGILARARDKDGGLDLEAANRALTEGEPAHIMLSRAAGLDLFRGILLEKELDPASEPFLKDHALNGVPVLPGVMGIEGFSAAATHVASVLGSSANGFRVERLEDVRFLTPFKFYRNLPRTIRWYAQVYRQPDGLVANVTLESNVISKLNPDEIVQHFSGRVYLDPLETRRPSPRVEPPHWNGGHTVAGEDVYRLYFHGPAFQVLDGVQRSGDCVVGRLREDLPPTTSSNQELLSAPLLIELCLQTAGIYEAGATGVLALPSTIGEVKLYSPTASRERVFAQVCPRADTGQGLSFDARVVDAGGQLYLELKDYRTSPLPYPAESGLVAPLKKLVED